MIEEYDALLGESNMDDDLLEEDESLDKENEASSVTELAQEAPKRKRGRPKGFKLGPRPTIWICSGLVDQKVIQERYMAPKDASDEARLNFSELEARALFLAQYKVEPVACDGPFSERRNVQGAQNYKKKEVIPALRMEYELGNRRADGAIFYGWRGLVYDVKILNPEEFKTKYGVTAQECCSFWPLEELHGSKKRNRTAPPPSLVLATALVPVIQNTP